ncbi:choice-of-anchor M domain-containing protein [Roseiconus lacunae]|uniref:choice-of-anchor M domain-containing protein n=1 Tax=Roseiconus lacunae TaxID=2605694 RepID=UPI001E4674C5|nr:choice-of-anchor M domain-containing protein [Roseiconus lacunae]MCD0460914.1 choice-of-anchor M domain-containing protein [Roseiconus lacunae]
MKKILFFQLLSILAVSICSSVAHAEAVEYTLGHGDIGLAYDGSELELHYHFGNGAVLDGTPLVGDAEYAPDEAFVRVGQNTMVETTGSIPFLGTTAGDPVWVLPQSNTPGVPFLGIATEELDGTFSGASLTMTSFSGPGEFALWQSSSLGGLNVFWQSNNGLDATDTLALSIGGHDHYNYGFTEAGTYDIGVTATADFASGGSVSDFGTLRFVVGNVSAVPEPSALAAMGALSSIMILRRRRRS